MAVLRKYQGSVGLGTLFGVVALEQRSIFVICVIIYRISLLSFDMESIRWYRIACMNSIFDIQRLLNLSSPIVDRPQAATWVDTHVGRYRYVFRLSSHPTHFSHQPLIGAEPQSSF